MAVTLTGGERQKRGGGTFGSVSAESGSTATALNVLGLNTDIFTISSSTATGFGINRHALVTSTATDSYPRAIEGQSALVVSLGTGEMYVEAGGSTATGAYVLSAAEDFVEFRYFNEVWHAMDASSATLATATMTA